MAQPVSVSTSKLQRFIRNPWLLSLLSGFLLAFSFPGPDIGWLAYFALVPLILTTKDSTPAQALWRALFAAFVFFGILISWIGVFASTKIGSFGAPIGLLLALVQAFFVAVAFSIYAYLRSAKTLPSWLGAVLLPCLWVMAEYWRQLGSLGMGWGDLGYSQWRNPVALTIAPFAGVWGISWFLVMVNVALAERTKLNFRILAGSAILLIGGGALSRESVRTVGLPYVAAALQTNINQDVPWQDGRPKDTTYIESTLNTFDEMGLNAANHQHAKLLFLAETAAPGYIETDLYLRNRLEQLSYTTQAAIVTGTRYYNPVTSKDRNIAALVLPSAQFNSNAVYAKQQLVPFGEFLPFKDQLSWITVLKMADFDDEPGESTQSPLDAGQQIGKIGMGICYESSYPRFMRQQTRAGANILAVITDDTWFGHTFAARQHLAMSAIRASESSRYLVRTAATGISAIFDPNGKELTEADLFTKAVVSAKISQRSGLTLFIRWGDWYIGLCGVVVLLGFANVVRGRLIPMPPTKLTEAR